mmetsp:Transcript_21957/g.46312  ORF Transcript_21957/g.46312 Transcript_21957/m.46312 type:complete len:295 (-) Transcript_21957:27-911(-)|eukprot:CAMPEP_0201119224 /NCGR_PEP_ID=MMETSP0850-20130426/3393_1 /ASSEMBLY_ACC=CAM_ASM_000622 /TAXON_ID=183588 /ORGANISM="Pseudo-nitzschia fraudulenta, Strain WWA7" /LENGTH=294 /DNA_ID=CAMNT_0047384853 /DNA_START=370 /DNA_END=1254 /DNA_ORIENTATION=+
MPRQNTLTLKLIFFLLLEVSSAYVLSLHGGIGTQKLSTQSIHRSFCPGSSSDRRHLGDDASDILRRNISVITLRSSFSNGVDENDDYETSTTIGGLKEDSSRIQQEPEKRKNDNNDENPSKFQRMFDEIPFVHLFFPEGRKKLPPVQVDDFGVMLYDVFLIVNLSLSISFWVTHRLDFDFIPYAFNEGCLFSILWIFSGLYHGSFLYSAMDGHYPLDDEKNRGGPQAAAALAFNTYINAINLRLLSALVGAWLQHRKVGEGSPMEELIPLEIGCGLVLMTMWRALHSQVTPRVR